MRISKFVSLIVFIPVATSGAEVLRPSAEGIYTLYRQSVVDIRDAARTHVATFDAAQGELYNSMNCQAVRAFFQEQKGKEMRYWCEKGYFKK